MQAVPALSPRATPMPEEGPEGQSRLTKDICNSSYIILVFLLVWLHGATFGATLGDGIIKPFLVLTVMYFMPMIVRCIAICHQKDFEFRIL
jgi:hypothetical protein